MDIAPLRHNQKAYLVLFMLDFAVQQLFEWVLQNKDDLFDQKLYDHIKKVLEKDRTLDEHLIRRDYDGPRNSHVRPWSLSWLRTFFEHIASNNKEDWPTPRCFRNAPGIASDLANELRTAIKYRNAVMHCRLMDDQLGDVAPRCADILRELAIYAGEHIEKEGQLSLLTLTMGELLELADLGDCEPPRLEAKIGHQILPLVRTWYPGYPGGAGDLHPELEWPEFGEDVPKYVSREPLSWGDIQSLCGLEPREFAGEGEFAPSRTAPATLELLTRKPNAFASILRRIKLPTACNSKAWSVYMPRKPVGSPLGRSLWPRNTDGLAHLVVW